jgi:hypothetical protein
MVSLIFESLNQLYLIAGKCKNNVKLLRNSVRNLPDRQANFAIMQFLHSLYTLLLRTNKQKIMMTKRETRLVYYAVAIAVIVIAFLLLGGGPWLKGMGHGSGSMGMTTLRWGQILIGMILGFVLGLISSRYLKFR